jgi:hypothetical protein
MRNDDHATLLPVHELDVRALATLLLVALVQEPANNITAVPEHGHLLVQ